MEEIRREGLEELLAMDKNIFSKVSPISFKKRKGKKIPYLIGLFLRLPFAFCRI